MLECDHKPLLAIFGEKKGIPQIAASRLQRWALILSAFDYEIRYKKGINNSNADCLSRLCVRKEIEEKFCVKNDRCYYMNNAEDDCSSIVDFKRVRYETSRDVVLAKVIDYINRGFPECDISDEMKIYKQRSDEMSVEKGIVMWGRRVVIPIKLRNLILSELHKSHLGIVKTKSIARSYFWWPKIDQEIENEIKGCRACRLCQQNPSRNILIPWEICRKPWERIHVDFLGPIEGKMYFIVLDAFSKWVEVFAMSSTNSFNTIAVLRQLFARFGLPDMLVSDNGTQLVSDEFKFFLKMNGIIHKTSTPGHPATNGAAENAVKSFKSAMSKAITNARLKNDKIEMNTFVQRYLFDYRISKHCATEESPAKLMYGRELKSRFDLLKPNCAEKTAIESNYRKIENFAGKRDAQFEMGENVVVRDYKNPNKSTWEEAKIKEQLGQRTYLCTTRNGLEWRRHVDQIATGAQPRTEQVNTPESTIDVGIPNTHSSESNIISMSDISNNHNNAAQSASNTVEEITDTSSSRLVPEAYLHRSSRSTRFKGKYSK